MRPSEPAGSDADDWEEHRRQVIGLGENSFRKSYYPELRRNETDVRNLILAIDQSPRGIFICRRDGRVEYANEMLLRIAGCLRGELVGHSPEVLWRHVEFGPDYAGVREALQGGRKWRGDLCLAAGAAESCWVQAFLAPIQDDTGDVTHFLGSMEDISARKQVEEELAATARARAQALEAVEHLSALKSQFIANMSHELRTPIFQILGVAAIGEQVRDVEKARVYAQKIKEAGDRLLQIVNAVLDFSELDSGRLTIHREGFLVHQLLSDLQGKWEHRVLARGLRFNLQVSSELPQRLVGDQRRLQQVLDELLGNAIKFTAHGEVRLSANHAARQVFFIVRDSGAGMTAEQLAACLQPFHQGDGSASRRQGGLGLGLSLCRQLVELMGGKFQIDSQYGVGTTITVALPVTP